MPDLSFSRLTAADLLAIERQPSQRVLLGMTAEVSPDEARSIAEQPVAWAARQAGRLIAAFGIVETFAGKQGYGWAILAPGIGRAHHALTRRIQATIARCGLERLEVLTPAPDIEPWILAGGSEDPADCLRAAWTAPTREMRWAVLLGLRPVHVLRRYGPTSETMMLFEKIGRAG